MSSTALRLIQDQAMTLEASSTARPWKSAANERAGEFWYTAVGDADADSLGDLPELRRRSRDALRNNPLAGAAITCKITNTIGTGLKLNASIDRERLGLDDATADAWEAQAEAEWAMFATSPNCDLARTLTFAEQQELAFRAVLENGDHFIAQVSLPRPRGDWPFAFALQHIEADRVCNPLQAQDTATLIAGVEKDEFGAPRRYHVAKLHPHALRRGGESQAWSALPAFGARTGRRVTLHLFKQLRSGQTRGVPDLAPVLTVLKQLDRYIDAEVDRAVKSALFLAFVTTKDGEGLAAMTPAEYSSDRKDYYREKKFDLDHSTVASLFPGDSIEFSDPKAPNAAAETFLTTFTRLIGAALEIPHEVLTRHFQSSYSAARGALLMAWQFFAGRRHWLAQALCQPVYEAVITDAISAGRLAAPGFLQDPFLRQAWLRSDWIGDAPPILDELKAVNAAKTRLEIGISTRKAETFALTGQDFDVDKRQRAKEARQEPPPAPAAATRPAPPRPRPGPRMMTRRMTRTRTRTRTIKRTRTVIDAASSTIGLVHPPLRDRPMTFRALDLIIDTPWALRAEALEQLLAIAARANEAPEAVAARLGRPLNNARTVTRRGDTAIIPITGPIFRRANLFTEISGATSVEILAQDLETAALDESIARIVLEIDSPGGQATGIADLAAMIRDAGQIKPVVAYVDGMAASAAYWLAAAATSIVTSPTGLLGSIGVVGSYQPEKDGPIKIISSQSPLKQATPDTEDGRLEAQRVVDELAAIFVADVARYRATTADTVLRDFGRGGVLVGAAAVAAGMADAVASFESLFPSSPSELSPRRVIGHHAHAPDSQGVSPMSDPTTAGAVTDQPALITEADLQAATALGREEGIATERARVTAILALLQDQPQALGMAVAAIDHGMAAEQALAMIAVAPAPALLSASDPAAYRAAWLADGAQSAPAADSATGAPGDEPGGDADANNARHWANNASLRAEFGTLERYQAFCTATRSGRVRILHPRSVGLPRQAEG